MSFAMKWLGAAVFAFGLMVGSRGAAAAEPAAADAATWGIYAQLVGTEWSDAAGNKVHWRWGADNTLVETRTFQMKTVISAGANPGELVSVYGGGLHTFDGRVAADGSVLWVRRGRFIKIPYRHALIDGAFVEETVKLDDTGQIAKVSSTGRYEQTAGAQVAAVVGNAPSAPSAVVAPATPKDAQGVLASVAASKSALMPGRTTPAAGTASATVALPNPKDFGVLGELAGRTFVYHDSVLTVELEESGNLLVLMYSNGMRYSFRRGAAPGELVVVDHPYNNKAPEAYVDNVGSLVYSFRVGLAERYRWVYRRGQSAEYEPLETEGFWKPGLISGYDSYYRAWFQPYSQEAVASELRSKLRYDQNRAVQAAREAASHDAIMSGFQQGLGEAAADHQQMQANHDALMANIQAQAIAAQEAQRQAQLQATAQQRAAAEQQQQTQADNARWAAEQQQEEQQADAARDVASTTPSQPAPQPQRDSQPATQQCDAVEVTGSNRGHAFELRGDAERSLRQMPTQCGLLGGAVYGQMHCTTDTEPRMAEDANGIPRVVGHVTMHQCEASYRCAQPRQVCKSAPAGASKQ